MITYQRETWAKYWKDARHLNQDSYDEAWPNKEKMPLKPNESFYKACEAKGMLQIVTVRDNGALVGFHISIIGPNTHSMDVLCSFQDACHLEKKYRGYVGIKMLMFAEKNARENGAKMLFWTAQGDGKRILPRLGFKPANTSYTKWIGE